MSLSSVAQDSFAAGIVRLTEGQRAPANSAYDIVNGLLDEEEAVYRRGGSAYKSTSDAPATLLGLWDGHVMAGRRTVAWTSTTAYALDAADTTLAAFATTALRPFGRGFGVGGLVAFPHADLTSNGGARLYGGSRKSAVYSTGSATATNGSRTVTGTGTAWLANVDTGMILAATGMNNAVVARVDSDTQLTLRDPATVTSATGAYSLSPFSAVTTLNVDAAFATGAAVNSIAIATVGTPTRLVIAINNRAYFSQPGLPFNYTLTNGVAEYHELPSSTLILGADSFRDNLVLFTTEGVWLVQNMNLDLTDANGDIQHVVTQINKDMILWGDPGVAAWRGALLVPALDDVYLLNLYDNPQSPPVPISQAIRPLYRSYVAAGHKPGLASVYKGQFFLPIVNSSNAWVDTLVCRLDGTDGRGGMRPGWTRWSGHAGQSTIFAKRVSESGAPKLLSANGLRVLDLTGTLDPTATLTEADGTTHQITIITRSFAATRSLKVLWKKLRARFDAIGAGAVVSCEYAVGDDYTSWTSVGSKTPSQSGETPVTWVLPTGGKRAQSIAFRLTSTTAGARLTLRSLEAFFRPNQRQ